MPAFSIGTYDIGASNKLNLLAAINAQNATSYTIEEYDFTEPKRVTTPLPTYNSSIKLGPRAATGKIGFKTIYYNRIHASDIGTLTITWQNELFLSEMLPRLSEKYGISLTTDDVFEQRIIPPVSPETQVNITLNFRDSSIAYYGSSVIVLGNNDPALEFEVRGKTPFKNDLIFYVNNFAKTKTGENYLESSIVSIDGDHFRSRSLNVTNIEASPFVSIIKNTYNNTQRVKLEKFLPFVFTWTEGTSKTVRGVNIYGDIVEINETSNFVEKVNSLFSINILNNIELTDTRDSVLVRCGTQDKDGNVYLVVADKVNSKVKLLKSTDYGSTFTEVTLTTTDKRTFDFTTFDDLVIHDFVVSNGNLYSLVDSPLDYPFDYDKKSNGPAVEKYNLGSGTSDYFPLLNEYVDNTPLQLVFDFKSKIRFVSSDVEKENIDVVGIAKTFNTLEPVVAYFSINNNNNKHRCELLGIKVLDYPIYGLSAFSKELVKDIGGYFVSVEILTMVPTSKRDDFFLIENNIKTENNYLGYGLITYSSIRKYPDVGIWNENVLDLGGSGSKPKTVTVTDYGKRNHYVFSGSNGIFKTKYYESSANIFTPILSKIFDCGSHPGFDLECEIGNGTFVVPDIEEKIIFATDYFELPGEEASKNNIAFSFLVKNKITSETMWLVSSSEYDVLVERSFSQEYGLMGDTPIALFSSPNNDLYAWTKYQGIFKSDSDGKNWVDHSVTKSYYSNPSYAGRSVIKLEASNFKSISLDNSFIFAEIEINKTLSVFNSELNQQNYPLVLSDKIIYKIDSSDPTVMTPFNSQHMTNSLNNTCDFSPRKVIAWETDSNNNVKVLSKYIEEGTPGVLNQMDIPVIHIDQTIDSYTNVHFMGLKNVILTSSLAEGSNLHLIKEDDTDTRIGLALSSSPIFADFTPLYIQPLWDGNDDSIDYTPILILSTNKKVLVLERDGVGTGEPTVNLINLSIPDDNSKPTKWFSMFNCNRKDRFFFQEDNGIFRLSYNYNSSDSKSELTLEKLFSLSQFSVGDIYSGTELGLQNVSPYGEVPITTWPVSGDILGNDCQGYTKRNKVSDGYGSYYWTTVETNSSDCGFTTPVEVPLDDNDEPINIGW